MSMNELLHQEIVIENVSGGGVVVHFYGLFGSGSYYFIYYKKVCYLYQKYQ